VRLKECRNCRFFSVGPGEEQGSCCFDPPSICGTSPDNFPPASAESACGKHCREGEQTLEERQVMYLAHIAKELELLQRKR
jgi:hypothetical protein